MVSFPLRQTFRLSPIRGLLIKGGITVALLSVLLARIDVAALWARITSIGPGVFALSVLIIFLLSVTSAIRWRLILAEMHSPIEFLECWRLVLIGNFFNQTLPSSIGGDAVRVWLTARSGKRLRTSFLSVVADRIFALAAVVICMVVALPLLLDGPAALPVGILLACVIIGLALLFGLSRVGDGLVSRLPSKFPSHVTRLLTHGIDVLRDLLDVLSTVIRDRFCGPLVMGLSLVNQVALGVVVYFIARALNADISLGDTLLLFPPAMLLSMAPISFGGWGVREGVVVWLLGSAGVPPDAALGTSVLFGLATTVAGLTGGVLWLTERRVRTDLPSDLSLQVISEELANPSGGLSTPRVLSRSVEEISPWVRVVAREIDFGDGRVEVYHALDQADYVGILAVTPDGLIPIVRQYRPALERYTCELPAGMVDSGERAEETCIRELREETGLRALRVHLLGVHAADSARLGNNIHSFLVEAEVSEGDAGPWPEFPVEFVTVDRLRSLILEGAFDLQYHVATFALAMMRPETAALLRRPENTEPPPVAPTKPANTLLDG